jgi:prepilin-type N-terminal cleavage/methylation domain-containing protein
MRNRQTRVGRPARSALFRSPSPLWGEGWGEGLLADQTRDRALTPVISRSRGPQSYGAPLTRPAGTLSPEGRGGRRAQRRGGFTLIELLIVIFIILIVSAVALPTIIPALSHRQVSEAARLLQGALVGARDAALRDNAPAGIRLLPDPAFPLALPGSTVPVDPTLPLAYNRMIPLQTAPEYSNGAVNIQMAPATIIAAFQPNFYPPFPPLGYQTTGTALMISEAVVGVGPTDNGQLLDPTSWFWNVRVGDKIQIGGSGPWYTIVGPMAIPPGGTVWTDGNTYANPEMFVNVGPPGFAHLPPYQFVDNEGTGTQVVSNLQPEYLFLVNGIDDNSNGWVDEGFDGVDNNNVNGVDEPAEWETETWHGSILNLYSTNPQNVQELSYTIQRRPAPAPNARETALPTNVVIDATTANTTAERSRLPVNAYTGYVDIVLNPNGSLVPAGSYVYSTPASVPLVPSFFHFWLAERADVYVPLPGWPTNQAPPLLPLPQGHAPAGRFPGGGQLNGEYRLVSLYTRTGAITTNDNVQFDFLPSQAFNVNLPFLQAQQGARSGQ